MFKDRLTKWEACKNYSAADVWRLFHRIANGETTPADATIHGLPVKWARVRRRIYEGMAGLEFDLNNESWLTFIEQAQHLSKRQSQRRSNVIRRPRRPGIGQSVPRALYTNSQLEEGRRLLVEVRAYLEGRLFQPVRLGYRGYINSWLPIDRTFDGRLENYEGMIHPAELNLNLTRGMRLLADDRLSPASVLIARASDVLYHLFQYQHGALTSCLLAAFTGSTTGTHPLTRSCVSEFTVEVAAHVLGDSHPVTLLCKYLHESPGSEGSQSFVFHFWGEYCKLYSNSLGLEHPMVIYVNQKHLEKLLDHERVDDASRHMRETLDPIFKSLFRRKPQICINVPASLCYLRRRARLHRCAGRPGEALHALKISKEIMIQALEQMQAGVAGSPVVEEVFRTLNEIALYYDSIGTTASCTLALEIHAFALEVCIAVRGDEDGKTYSMISTLEHRYSTGGDHGRADSLRLRFPAVFWEGEVDSTCNTKHLLPCSFCGNGPDTQVFCDRHNTSTTATEIEEKQKSVIVARLRALFWESGQE